jgi:hypothetical protein
LDAIFNQAGMPNAIIKDGDHTPQKGVRLWSEKQGLEIPVIADIGHSMATTPKQQFEKTASYKRFTALITQGANRLRQTGLAFLIPPKLRSKGRFQSVNTLGKWADKTLDVFAVQSRAKKGGLLANKHAALPGFLLLNLLSDVLQAPPKWSRKLWESLKTKALIKSAMGTVISSRKHCQKIPKPKKHLQKWLRQHLDIQKQLTDLPLLVSSDIIESLSGNFKHI